MSLVHKSEMHRFRVGKRHFAFLVPSSMVLELDDEARSVLDGLERGPLTAEKLASVGAGWREALGELVKVGAVTHQDDGPNPPSQPEVPYELPPLGTLVLSVTNNCNLSCRYCYEYGGDQRERPARAAVMTAETARQSVELLLSLSGRNRKLQLTFFGGETLLNWKVIHPTVEYARRRAAEEGKLIDFSLTTNATLLSSEIIRWLAENHIGVTVSIDGPAELQDEMRVYASGRGTYDVVAPAIEELVRLHRSRPIGARVTVTSRTLDIPRVFNHLVHELGFHEVGFAPVTSSSQQDYSLHGKALDRLLEQFRALAEEFVEGALHDRYVGFSNLSDLLREIRQGVAKAYPCGAGLGLLGVAPGGEVGLCHRFAGSGEHDFGHVASGVDQAKRAEHLKKAHLEKRAGCRTCWVRSLCAGGCYHEAEVRYGDRFKPNLHYCDWIRSWTALGLEVYANILDRNPAYLERFDPRRVA